MTDAQQRAQLDLLSEAQQAAARAKHPTEAELAARIESFELAYRMQMAAPEALDVDSEPEHDPASCTASTTRSATHFARQCLIARRLVERGVRFVQIYSGGMENERSWDGHIDIDRQPPRSSPARPTSPSPACSPTSSSAGCSIARW